MGTVFHVAIEAVNGKRYEIEAGTMVRGGVEKGEDAPVPISLIPAILSDPNGWVEFESEVALEADGWAQETRVALVRLYGRGTAAVEVYR